MLGQIGWPAWSPTSWVKTCKHPDQSAFEYGWIIQSAQPATPFWNRYCKCANPCPTSGCTCWHQCLSLYWSCQQCGCFMMIWHWESHQHGRRKQNIRLSSSVEQPCSSQASMIFLCSIDWLLGRCVAKSLQAFPGPVLYASYKLSAWQSPSSWAETKLLQLLSGLSTSRWDHAWQQPQGQSGITWSPWHRSSAFRPERLR